MRVCWRWVVLSMGVLIQAAPPGEPPAKRDHTLAKRDMCTITGIETVTMDAFGGGRYVPDVTNAIKSYFLLEYVGGKELKNWNGNTISQKWQTLPKKTTGLPWDLEWTADYMVGSFRSCKIKLNGREIKGKVGGGGGGLAENVAKCSVDFECPGHMKLAGKG